MKRVGTDLRVSTDSQTAENQQQELETVVERSGWDVVGGCRHQRVEGHGHPPQVPVLLPPRQRAHRWLRHDRLDRPDHC